MTEQGQPLLPPVVAIVGPTGVGKSALAMRLATTFGGEIISADSRQVYRHMDIGTAKPTLQEQREVPHHVIDVINPDQRYSVADFVRDAGNAFGEISRRHRIAIIAGGSGYYVRALLRGQRFVHMDEVSVLEESLEAEIRERGSTWAIQEIAQVDPASAARVDAANPRRVARALAIIRHTGEPIAPAELTPIPALLIGLTQERTRLYRRLDQRVESQIAAGLPEETRRVLEMGYPASLPVMKGLAYGQMLKLLSGEWDLAEATQAYKFATHRLVRRQMTWFRKESDILWVDVDEAEYPAGVVVLVERHLRGENARQAG